MDNYLDSTSPEYVRRMASTLNAKWEALAPYVMPGARVLDYGCGMPVENGIRERVEAVGGVYECHDISTTVETAMRDAGATFRTKEDLQERAGGYDVVFLSSVVHELTGQDDGFEEIEAIWGLSLTVVWLSFAIGRESGSRRAQSCRSHLRSSQKTLCAKSSLGLVRSH